MNLHDTMLALEQGAFDRTLKTLYACEDCKPFRLRFLNAVKAFREEFKADDSTEIALFSAPGRTELGGNNTDHQGGHVLAASLNGDIIAVAAKRDTLEINLKSEGMEMDSIDLTNLAPHQEELNTSAALLRGIAAKFTELGWPVTGFDAYTTSDILKGSGLSSSAAFEVLTGTICSAFFADSQVDPVQIAQIGQYAENEYFGKPCGLMDQMGCSVGGVIAIDFAHTEPEVTRAGVDLTKEGYALCILDSGADHADLTDAYAAVPAEMKAVAAVLGVQVLSQTTKAQLIGHLREVRKVCGDRAALRALHYFADDKRVKRAVRSLQNGYFEQYLAEIRASGHSSFAYLQNVSVYADPRHQEVALTIALCDELLGARGAVRVHGGGFAGTIQAFVKNEALENYRSRMDQLFGKGACHVLLIRPCGGVQVI